MGHEPISSDAFREALAHFATGVTVVTARGLQGFVGFTATGFASVSLSPPVVLVCIGKGASAHEAVIAADHFGVSVLSDGQTWIAEQFARSGIDRFRGVSLEVGLVPLVEGSIGHLACRRHACHEVGDHTILFGEVIDAAVREGRPLVHFVRRFGTFAPDGVARTPAAPAPLPPQNAGST